MEPDVIKTLQATKNLTLHFFFYEIIALHITENIPPDNILQHMNVKAA